MDEMTEKKLKETKRIYNEVASKNEIANHLESIYVKPKKNTRRTLAFIHKKDGDEMRFASLTFTGGHTDSEEVKMIAEDLSQAFKFALARYVRKYREEAEELAGRISVEFEHGDEEQ